MNSLHRQIEKTYLPKSPWRVPIFVFMLLLTIFFSTRSIQMYLAAEDDRLGFVLFTIVLIALTTLQLIQILGSYNRLILTRTGLEFSSFIKSRKIEWGSIGDFYLDTTHMPGSVLSLIYSARALGIDDFDALLLLGANPRNYIKVTKINIPLNDLLGMSKRGDAEKIILELNAWRKKYGRPNTSGARITESQANRIREKFEKRKTRSSFGFYLFGLVLFAVFLWVIIDLLQQST